MDRDSTEHLLPPETGSDPDRKQGISREGRRTRWSHSEWCSDLVNSWPPPPPVRRQRTDQHSRQRECEEGSHRPAQPETVRATERQTVVAALIPEVNVSRKVSQCIGEQDGEPLRSDNGNGGRPIAQPRLPPP